ncbi:MAG: DoxX family protein [Acidobacteria bacterium]|nr:DoxX family protein [Acidobacteriota bacterium]
MHIVLWVLQLLLAVAFFAHGWLFLSPPPEIAEQMNASLPRWFQIFLGIAEVLAAVGLTLPGLARILPWLVAWAAAGIMIVTASATAFHVVRSEMSSAAITAGAAGHGHGRRVHAASCPADQRPRRIAIPGHYCAAFERYALDCASDRSGVTLSGSMRIIR